MLAMLVAKLRRTWSGKPKSLPGTRATWASSRTAVQKATASWQMVFLAPRGLPRWAAMLGKLVEGAGGADALDAGDGAQAVPHVCAAEFEFFCAFFFDFD